MQPHELVVQGLTAFTAPITVDFRDAPLFAIVGATGAGKSTILDSMTLALYGRVARLGKGELAPVMTTGSDLCRVGLTFGVRGRRYRAVREVRRTARGVTTPEAVLDEIDDAGALLATLAGTADQVTVAVQELLGLSFDEFCKAVILPQGQFAEVLHAPPAKRQDLLVTLLGTAVYERVKVMAGQEARGAVVRADQIARQVLDLGDVSAADVDDARERVAQLVALEAALAEDDRALDEAREAHRVQNELERAALGAVERLAAIGRPPDGLLDLTGRITVADELLAKHHDAAAQAAEALSDAQGRLEGLGDAAELTAVLSRHAEVTRLVQEEAAAAERVPQLASLTEALEAEVTDAEARAAAAQAAVAAQRREHAAAQAAAGLVVGDACPVCARELLEAPDLHLPADLDAAESAATAALRGAAQVGARLERARHDLAAGRGDAKAAAERAAAAREEAAALPAAAAAQQALAGIASQRAVVARVTAEAREALAGLDAARAARAALDAEAAAFRTAYDRGRVAVGDFGPPEPVDDLVASWEALGEWAEATALARRALADAAAAEQQRIAAAGGAVRARMDAACAAAGVAVVDGKPLPSAVAARAQAQARAAHLAEVAERVVRLRAEEVAARHQAEVAELLARLLRADAFPRWLLDQATRALVQGASRHLMALSRDRYELDLDDRGGIAVVDLASAGQRRSVKTLSGGETFLASLALALSLAEQIAEQAASQVALESLFIDEGFGALDPDALDVAADAIEQLGSGDRVVGVVTHVTDLADRLPTRYQVTRSPGGSRVARIG